jgi:hypothetical protein
MCHVHRPAGVLWKQVGKVAFLFFEKGLLKEKDDHKKAELSAILKLQVK